MILDSGLLCFGPPCIVRRIYTLGWPKNKPLPNYQKIVIYRIKAGP